MRTLLVAVLGSLAFSGTARAADYYVDASSSGTSGCTTAAPCHTVQQGLIARNNGPAGASTIHVATGTYPAFSVGIGGDPITIEAPVGGVATISGDVTSNGDGVAQLTAATGDLTLRRLLIGVPSNTTKVANGIYAQAGKLTLDQVAVNVAAGGTSNGYALASNPGATVVARGSNFIQHQNEDAVYATGDTTLEDSAVTTDGAPVGNKVVGAFVAGGPGTMRIVRSVLTKDNGSGTRSGYAFLVQLGQTTAAPTMVMDSSLLKGGETPIGWDQKAQTTNWTMQNVTVDGRDKPPMATPYVLEASQVNGRANMTWDSSIILGTVGTGSFFRLTCTYSAILSDAQSDGSFGNTCLSTAPTNTAGGDAFDPSSGYRPAAGSSVVDTGNPNVPAGFSATEISGLSRTLSSTGSCTGGLRDRGAFEYAGNPGVPPSVTIDGADTQSGAMTVAFTRHAVETLSYAWSTDDGATGTGANFFHQFTTNGVHTVTLVGTKPNGCATTATKTVTVSGITPAGGTGGGGTGGGTTSGGTTTTTGTSTTPVTTTPPVKPIVTPGGTPSVAKVDTTKPKITFRKLTAKRLTLKVSEQTTVAVKLCRPGKARRGKKAKAICRTVKGSGAATVKIALKKLPKAKYSLTITGVDAAGNSAEKVKKKTRVT